MHFLSSSLIWTVLCCNTVPPGSSSAFILKCISSSKALVATVSNQSQLARSICLEIWSVQVSCRHPTWVAAPSLAGLSVWLWRWGIQRWNNRAAGTEECVQSRCVCASVCICWSSGAPAPYSCWSCGWLHWHTLVACGAVPGWPQSKDCLSFTVWSCLLSIHLSSIYPFIQLIHSSIHSSYLASHILLHGAMWTRPWKINSWVSVWKDRWLEAWGASGGHVRVTWEGSPCNGRLLTSVFVAASNTSWSAPALLAVSLFPLLASVSGTSAPM